MNNTDSDKLVNIKAMLFDVDGVLSLDTTPLSEDGNLVRTSNVKDGYAIRNALNMGYHIGVITGGNVGRVRLRYEMLGVRHIYMGVIDKMPSLHDFMSKTGITSEQIMYMGDDLIDYRIMSAVGLAACPIDAAPEIREIAGYVSTCVGGRGCVRDIIEQIMRTQGTWINEHSYFWRSV